MDRKPSLIERAYQLADSGECATTTVIRARLAAEGYGHGMIIASMGGRGLNLDLRRRIAAAPAPAPEGKRRPDADLTHALPA